LITSLSLHVYDTSVATIDGASVAGGLYARDSSEVTMNDGYVGGSGIQASGSASVAVLGGRVIAFFDSEMTDSSVITLGGGSVRGLSVEDSSSAFLVGGTVDGALIADDSSSVVFDAGLVSALLANDSSSLVMSGGEVSGDLRVRGSSSAEISGGSIQSLYFSSDAAGSISGGLISSLEITYGAPLSISGGTIGALSSYDATATVEGGSVSEIHVLTRDATVFLRGSGFAVDGFPVPYGDLEALTGTLTGTLASGDAISSVFTRELFLGERGAITLIPEPSTAVLLFSGLAGLAATTRRRRVEE
jgi:hypothetical protein